MATKTLIIHPTDRSTDFLKPIYQHLYYKTVVTKGITMNDFAEELATHERIMAMGHGSPYGLFAMGLFSDNTYGKNGKWRSGAICKEDIASLKGKDNVYIWCNADDFVVEHKLTGFYSGMFISEVGEAHAMGVGREKSHQEIGELVTESNNAFAELLGEVSHKKSNAIYSYLKKYYGKLAESNEVAKYNCDRLYFNNGKMPYMKKPKVEYQPYRSVGWSNNGWNKKEFNSIDDIDMFDREFYF